MSSVPASGSPRPQNRVRPWLPWAAGAVFVAGVIGFVIAYDVGGLRNTADVKQPVPSNEPATPLPVKRVTVKPDKQALAVIVRFLETAVPRRNLVESYRLTAPELRQGMTLREWKTGTIPVGYYPVGKGQAGLSPYRVEWSYRDDVVLRILLTPPKGEKLKAQEFWVGAKLVGKGDARSWKVYYFAPRWFPPRFTVND